MLTILATAQALVAVLLMLRLAGGRARRPPETPVPDGTQLPGVSVVVPTLNEAERIGPCLAGLRAQGAPVKEILVVDSGSTDGTRELVQAAAALDPRIVLLTDPPLPGGWVGKAWALQYGLAHATQPWVLGMDADTQAEPGCAAATVRAALREQLDVVSFAPRFDGQTAFERWLQPAMLVTLLYRNGAVGDPRVRAERMMANGQCFLADRQLLLTHGGYEPVRTSFAEDVSLARRLAARGARVGFLDGARLYTVRGYRGAGEMWREWGRSFDLSDATHPVQQAFDALFVLIAQGAVWPVAVWLALAWRSLPQGNSKVVLALATVALVGMRWLLLPALRGSYARRGVSWWLSPLADPLAAIRLLLSTVRRPRSWRTRRY